MCGVCLQDTYSLWKYAEPSAAEDLGLLVASESRRTSRVTHSRGASKGYARYVFCRHCVMRLTHVSLVST